MLTMFLVKDEVDDDLGFDVRTVGYEPLPSSTLSLYGGFSHVIEPHREAIFSAKGAREGSQLTWRIARVAAKPEESSHISAPFYNSHEWMEEGEVVEKSGSSASIYCRNANDRFRVTLTETLSSSSKTSTTSVEGGTSHGEVWIDPEIADSDNNLVVQSRGWLFYDENENRRRRVATSDAVACKYVRRELRKLTDGDRDRYLQAVAEVHRTPRLIKSLLKTHLGQDTLKHCSIFHGGNTFLTAHAAFQYDFERLLQQVDPSIASTYWDTSVDDLSYGSDWRTSTPVLKWFSLDEDDSTYTYFSGLEIPTDLSVPEHNAYGRMTQAYNNDNARYVWRTDSVCGFPSKLRLPGCAALEGALRQSTLSDFRAKLETDFHSVLHPALGGAFDCEPMRGGEVVLKEQSTTALATSLSQKAPQLLQFLHSMLQVAWDTVHASGNLACPTSCDEAQPFESCACTCPGYNFNSQNADTTSDDEAYTFLEKTGVLNIYVNSQRGDVFVKSRPDTGKLCLAPEPNADCLEDDDHIWINLAALTCSPGRVSPYMTPLAAPLDPLFWVTHLQFERIWAFKRLIKSANIGEVSSGSVLNDDDHLNDQIHDDFDTSAMLARAHQAAADALEALSSVVPDKDSADFESWDWLDANSSTTTDHAVSSYCFGKAWTDPTPFSVLLPSDNAERRYTQADLYEFFNPKNAKLPYIFEDVEWTHCRS